MFQQLYTYTFSCISYIVCVKLKLMCCICRGKVTSCSLVLYGHTARVWDARLMLCDSVISIGEDASCRVWDREGRCVKIVEGHRGRNIWSMAVDQDSGLVVSESDVGTLCCFSVRYCVAFQATGGGDCSIRLFTLETHSECKPLCVRWSVHGPAHTINVYQTCGQWTQLYWRARLQRRLQDQWLSATAALQSASQPLG